MTGVNELRKQIDEADAGIVELLAARLLAARIIGRRKKKTGKPARNPKREREVMEKTALLALAKGISQKLVSAVFTAVMEEGLDQQANRNDKIVAFQGERGAYSEEAAAEEFSGCTTLPCATFEKTLEAVGRGDADLALLPVENSTEGIVTGVHDLLVKTRLKAVGEVYLRVRHCLLALAGEDIASVREVYSHPQALAQCSKFLQKALPSARLIPFYDTAGAAKMISAERREGAAAIASRAAAGNYGLSILAEGIEDNKPNYTRFLAFAKKPAVGTGEKASAAQASKKKTLMAFSPAQAIGEKTSIVFSVADEPGALSKFLDAFEKRGINLSRIESRPAKREQGQPWEYVFFMDFEAGAKSPKARRAMKEAESCAKFIKVIGSYPAGRLRSRRLFK